MVGALLAVGATLLSVAQRRDEPAAAAEANVSQCAQLKGDAARACYSREVGRELASMGARRARSFARRRTRRPGDVRRRHRRRDSAALLCDLHLRVGVDRRAQAVLGRLGRAAVMSRARIALLAASRCSCSPAASSRA